MELHESHAGFGCLLLLLAAFIFHFLFTYSPLTQKTFFFTNFFLGPAAGRFKRFNTICVKHYMGRRYGADI
jgi:hypothetical protein